MKSLGKKQLLLITIFLLLVSFTFLSEFLHTEKHLLLDYKCPVCNFKIIATLFFWISYLLIIFRLFQTTGSRIFNRDQDVKSQFITSIFGQRAPPGI